MPSGGDLAVLVLPKPILTAASPLERRLTILHECLHIAFAFGEYRDRFQATQLRGETMSRAIQAMAMTGTPVEQVNFELGRLDAAFMFVQLPDEILAEQRLQRDHIDLSPLDPSTT